MKANWSIKITLYFARNAYKNYVCKNKQNLRLTKPNLENCLLQRVIFGKKKAFVESSGQSIFSMK